MWPSALLLLTVGIIAIPVSDSAGRRPLIGDREKDFSRLEREYRNGDVHRQHSLHPPFVTPFLDGIADADWIWGGSTVLTEQYIRLAPSTLQSTVGYMWNVNPVPEEITSWEIRFGFDVNNPGHTFGADGFAIWLTEEIDTSAGPLMGHSLDFSGIGIIFDQYDNDNVVDNPAIYVIGKGPQFPLSLGEFSPNSDFRDQTLARCTSKFRGRKGDPGYGIARITYERNVLTVSLANENVHPYRESECLTSRAIQIPPKFYIGLTASTGTVTDNHDIFFFHFVPIVSPGEREEERQPEFRHDEEYKERASWHEKGDAPKRP